MPFFNIKLGKKTNPINHKIWNRYGPIVNVIKEKYFDDHRIVIRDKYEKIWIDNNMTLIGNLMTNRTTYRSGIYYTASESNLKFERFVLLMAHIDGAVYKWEADNENVNNRNEFDRNVSISTLNNNPIYRGNQTNTLNGTLSRYDHETDDFVVDRMTKIKLPQYVQITFVVRFGTITDDKLISFVPNFWQ
jgi:hypothetical protein